MGHLVFGDGEGFVAKLRSKRNGKKNGRPTKKQEKRETLNVKVTFPTL